MDFDERRFRDALGAFATGVAVVTGLTETGERAGMTVSSFNSVSLTPPLVLFSVARRARSFDAWTRMPATPSIFCRSSRKSCRTVSPARWPINGRGCR